MDVYLRATFEVSSIILTSFRRGLKRTPKKPTQTRGKRLFNFNIIHILFHTCQLTKDFEKKTVLEPYVSSSNLGYFLRKKFLSSDKLHFSFNFFYFFSNFILNFGSFQLKNKALSTLLTIRKYIHNIMHKTFGKKDQY